MSSLQEDRAHRDYLKRFWDEIYDDFDDAYELVAPVGFHWMGHKNAGHDKIAFTNVGQQGAMEYVEETARTVVPPTGGWGTIEPGEEIIALGRQAMQNARRELKPINEFIERAIERSGFYEHFPRMGWERSISAGVMLSRITTDMDVPLKVEAVPHWNVTYCDQKHHVYRSWKEHRDKVKMRYGVDRDDAQELSLFEVTKRVGPDQWETTVRFEDDEDHTLFFQTYTENPWLIARAHRPAGNPVGRGPGLEALADLRELNRVAFDKKVYRGRTLNPAYNMDDDGVAPVTGLRIGPGVIIPRRPQARGLEPVMMAGNINWADFDTKELEQRILERFRHDTLPDPSQGARTLGELRLRRERDLQSTEPNAVSFGSELIEPLMRRMVAAMRANGTLTRDFPKIDGKRLRFSVDGPLQKLRKTVKAMRKVEAIGLLNSTAGVETTAQAIDVVGAVANASEDLGFDVEEILTEEERAEVGQVIAQQRSLG